MDFLKLNPHCKIGHLTQCLAHNGFETEQCSETLNALKPFKTVFFSTGCANMMDAHDGNVQCNAVKCNGAQNAMAHNGAA